MGISKLSQEIDSTTKELNEMTETHAKSLNSVSVPKQKNKRLKSSAIQFRQEREEVIAKIRIVERIERGTKEMGEESDLNYTKLLSEEAKRIEYSSHISTLLKKFEAKE